MLLGDCEEKMALISSSTTTSNEWPPQTQNNQIDEKGGLGMNSSASRVLMEKPNQDQQQQIQQQVPLKCPRCDSSNTKFCYYNNYSLSQPRHFCKACKRYWTRGGTLRNVPVGGGCRKNKRVKRPASSLTHEVTSSSSATSSLHHQTAISSNPSSTTLPQLDLSSSSAAARSINPLFYSLLTNNNHDSSSDLNSLAYPRFSTSSNGNYELHQPQMNDLGVGFSSSGLLASYNNGFSSSKQIQDVIPSSTASLLSSGYMNPIFGSLSSTTSSSTISSLLASSFQKQNKLVFGGLKDGGAVGNNNGFHGGGLLEPYEDMQMAKDVKMEWSNNTSTTVGNGQSNINHINPQINSTNSDQSLLWNTAWLDPSNMGSSVPSLI